MKYIKLKKYLIKNKILLFDAHYRLIHHRLNIIKQQTGGSVTKKNIKKLSEYQLYNFIDCVLYNNNHKMNYYIKLFQENILV
jgi:hypothetical protein